MCNNLDEFTYDFRQIRGKKRFREPLTIKQTRLFKDSTLSRHVKSGVSHPEAETSGR